MLPVSGAEQLKAIGAIAGLRPISSQSTPYSQLAEPGAVALVGHEQVPQALVAGLGADLDQDLAGRACPGATSSSSARIASSSTGIDVLVHERANPVAQLLDPGR